MTAPTSWTVRTSHPLPAGHVALEDALDPATGRRVYRVRVEIRASSLGYGEALAERLVLAALGLEVPPVA